MGGGWGEKPVPPPTPWHPPQAKNRCLHAELLLEGQILLVEGVDTINHGLNKLDLGVAQTVLVGNVVSVSSLAARFAAGTTGLDIEFLAPLLELVNAVLGPSWEIDVDGSSHASAQVGWARVDVTKLGRNLEVLARLSLDGVLDSLDASGQSLENALDVTALLHGDDTELILLVDPDKEGLGLVVEDATAFRPIALHTSDLEVGIARHEQEVVVNELLADLLVHASQCVVVSGKITAKLGKGALHQVLNADALLLGDSGRQAESLDGAANTDSDRVDGDLGFDVSLDLGDVHVRGVLEVSRKSMVLADEGIEDIGEVDVGVLISGVDAAVLVVEVNGTSNGLGQGEAGSLGDDATELVPLLLGHVSGDQAAFRLDVGEVRSGHFCLFVCLVLRTDFPAQS